METIMKELDFKIEKTKDSLDILRINKNDKWIYIGSKYNMKLEIEKFLNKFTNVDEVNSVIIVYGFGTGDHIRELRNKYKKNEIIVFEPNVKIKEYVNEKEWIQLDNKLSIIFGNDKKDIFNALDNKITEFNVNFVNFMWFANYDHIYNEDIDNLIKELKQIFTSLRIQRNTKKNFSKSGFISLMENIKYMIHGIPADIYKDKYKDKPAIIVSAGPSLEKNIDLLKHIDDDMLIISGGRTLKPLLEKNIDPDLLVVVDPLPISYELCKDYIEDLNKPLLFYEGSNIDVVRKHQGMKLFYTYNKSINKIAGHEIEKLHMGGSVAHIMTSYAALIGCNPIIFIGQDLAYTDNQSHANIAKNIIDKKEFEDNDDIYLEGVNGDKVRTSILLNEYRRKLEEIIELYPEIKFINSTEGGARIKGTSEIALKDAINMYRGEKIEKFMDVNYSVDMRSNAIKYLEETKLYCKKIIKKYKEAIDLIGELKKVDNKNVDYTNNILNKLNKIDNEVKYYYKKIDIVDSLIYPIVYEIMSEKSSEYKEKNNIFEKNERLYSGVNKELKYAIEKIEEVLLQIGEK